MKRLRRLLTTCGVALAAGPLCAPAAGATLATRQAATAPREDPEAVPAVLPVDEAADDPSFFAFRARLQRAIARRDTTALLAAVHPRIRLSFGPEEGGKGVFRTEWLEADAEEDVWAELGEVLALGGRFDGDSTFVAPYTFTDSPDHVDPFEALIAIGDSVPVRSAAQDEASVVATLSFGVVRHEWRTSVARPPAGWMAIRLPDDALGFVRCASVRSPLDYRAIFRRTGGRWWIAVFIAGD